VWLPVPSEDVLVQYAMCLLAACSILTALPDVGPADAKREAKPRFKGVELYSWKDEGDWVFVLLDGTNRDKTAEEVKSARNKIKGADALKEAIALLAEGEQVSWSHRVGGFEFPGKKVRESVGKAAKDAGVELSINAKD
jgi:hypothetical protein